MREIEVILQATDYTRQELNIYKPNNTSSFNWRTEIIGHKLLIHFYKKIDDGVTLQQYWSFIKLGDDYVFDNGYALKDLLRWYKLSFKDSQSKVFINPLEKLVSA